MQNMMPDPISSEGLAIQAKTQGMTPDQVQALDQQYASAGIYPLNYTLTLYDALNKLKQSGQSGPPPQTTVTQDLQQQINTGLGGLQSNLGNEAAYARGGIVAFSGRTGSFVPPYDAPMYTAEELAALGRQAEEAANEAAVRRVPDPPGGRGKGFFTRPRTVAGVSNWTEAGQKVGKYATNAAKYAAEHPYKTAGKLAKGTAGIAAIPFLWDFGKLSGMDPRYLREAYGDTSNLYANDRDWLRITGAAAQDQVPFLSDTLYERAKAAEEADKVKPLGQDWELQYAVEIKNLRKQGRNAEADALTEEYRAKKSRSNVDSSVDLSKYLKNDTGDGGLSSLAASMGLGNDPRAMANGYMGDALSRAQGMIGAAPDRDAEIAAVKARRTAAGIGGSYEEDRARYQQELSGIPEEDRANKWRAAAEGFFEMARAGGESGASMWGAAGAGGSAGLAAYNKSMDKLEAKEERLRDKLSEVRRYEEQLAAGDIAEGSAEYRYLDGKRTEAQNNAIKISADRDKLAAELSMQQMSIRANIAIAKIQQSGRGRQIERLQQAFIDAQTAGDQEHAAGYLKMIEDLAGMLPQVQAAQIRADSKNIFGLPQMTGDQGILEGTWNNLRVTNP